MSQSNNTRLAGTLSLILGGVRSGKSRFGQELAHTLGGDDVLFVATAESRDEEMTRRIELHRQSRPLAWRTLEQPLVVGETLAAMPSLPKVVLLDCLTLLVSNVMLAGDEGADAFEHRVRDEVHELISLAQQRELHLVIVSGEVGMGVVPDHLLGRMFRDQLGWSNQAIAAQATSTFLMVAGLPVNMTKIATSVEQAAIGLGNFYGTVTQG